MFYTVYISLIFNYLMMFSKLLKLALRSSERGDIKLILMLNVRNLIMY
jgi:hypothetical protein